MEIHKCEDEEPVSLCCGQHAVSDGVPFCGRCKDWAEFVCAECEAE